MARTTRRKSAPVRKPRNVAKEAIARINALRDSTLARTRLAREALISRASEARVATADAVSRFEKVFENRVTGVISRLGVPTARDVRALSRQVAHLQQSVDQLRRVRAR